MPGTPSCRVVSENDSTGKAHSLLKYDANGNLIEIDYIDSNVSSSIYVYSNNRLVECSRHNLLTQFKYNNANRLDTIVRSYEDKITQKIIFEYDVDGNISSKTTYQQSIGNIAFHDSCVYSLYINGRPQRKEYIMKYADGRSEVMEVYEYEYDSKMNRTKVYRKSPAGELLLREESTFDLNIDMSSVAKYYGLHLISDYGSDEEVLFITGAPNDRNLKTGYKLYSADGQVFDQMSISDVKIIYGKFLKSAKKQLTSPFGMGFIYSNLNYSYSCE